jgi:hypothetical protein
MSGDNRGWFADIDEGTPSGDMQWAPFLQLDWGAPSMDVWFASEEDCLRFIREEVVGKGVL